MIDGLHESGRTNFFIPLGPGRGDTLRGSTEDVEAAEPISSLTDIPDTTEPGGDIGTRLGIDLEAEVLDLASIYTT